MTANISEREAELAALQSAFDEYITSSRELEEELDAELAKMQEKLADSACANAALSSQLENIAPQLASLEKALSDSKDKLDEQVRQRRAAELAQDEAENQARKAEGSVQQLQQECDAAHEELAFCSSELEETRLELEVERARRREEAAVASVKEEEQGGFPTLTDKMDQEHDYVKRLEEELELVTEQLIDAEKRLAEAEEEKVQQQQLQQQQVQKKSFDYEQEEEKKQHSQDELDSHLLLQEEAAALREDKDALSQQLAISREELALTREELQAAEEDSKRLALELETAQATHRQEVQQASVKLDEATQASRSAEAELSTLEETLQAATAENDALTKEVQNLNVALENAKSDHAAVVQELEAVDARFDVVRKEAQQEGRRQSEEAVRTELQEQHSRKVDELEARMEVLQKEHDALQLQLDEAETKVAARNANSEEKSELVLKLEAQLARVKEQVSKRDETIATLKEQLTGRVTKAEHDVERLEKELAVTSGKLAEAEAHLIVSKREQAQATRTIPVRKQKEYPTTPLVAARGRIMAAAGEAGRPRARSSSPTTPQRLEYQINVETTKTKTLQQEYDALVDQHRMGEIRIKRLEHDLKSLQSQQGGGVATHLSHLSQISQPQDDTLLQDEAENDIQDIVDSRDPKRISTELLDMDKKYKSQRDYNAQLLSKILSLQGNIQVCCRVRPLLGKEGLVAVEALSESEVGCCDARTKKWKSFCFDKVWSPDLTQKSVFADVEPLALSVVDGYNACIFAYGQTGSGKTFTMEGIDKPNQHGISYRTIQKIFNLLNLRSQQQKAASRLPPMADDEGESRQDGETDGIPSFDFSLEVGMLEIYNDEVYDLLVENAKGTTATEKKKQARESGGKATLEIRRNADGKIEVPDLRKEPVTSIADVMNLLKRGNANRATASTDLNEHSSRSHMVLSVDVKSGLSGQQPNKGTLYLVDLAGSERVRKSNVEGEQLKEAGFINKSLSALGNVMEALDRKASHVPYRDSKLTYLLQDSLGGNSRTMMIVTVCPMDTAFDESVHALQFATRVRRIQLGAAQRNVTSRNLEETVKSLTAEMKLLTQAKEKSESQLHSLRKDNTRIQGRLQSISQSRAKTQSENRTLDVLRKNNTEMANRWQKEKSMREKTNAELEKIQGELKKVQQQLSKTTRENDSITLKLQEKEEQLERSARELKKAKEASSAANIRARTAQIIGSRATGIRTPSKRVATASTASVNSETPNSQQTPMSDADVAEIREKVLVLLEKYDDTKVGRIDIIMEKFKGKEALLLEKMVQRYEGQGDAQAKLKKRSEMALARHKERMRTRLAENKQ